MYEQGRCQSSGPIRFHDYFAAVKLTAIAVPLPGSLLSSIFAPWYCAACLTMERPRPVPPTSLWMIFIDAVKSLKYTALVGVGNTNASIYDRECCRRPILPDGNGNIAARNVIFDCVVAQIIDHFLQKLLNAWNHSMLSGKGKRDILSLRDRTKTLNHAACQHIQINRCFCEVRRALVQPGKLNDVVYQIN